MDKIYIIGHDPVPQYVSLGAGESLRMTLIALPGTSARLCIQVDINGEGCEVDIAGAYLCTGEEDLRIDVLAKHNAPGSVSRQLFKGLAGGYSRFEFNGLIYIAKGAGRTSAYQESHSILLSRDAKVENRPQLEIYADDVACSHGCTTGFLNAEEAFYLRSRGIPREEAERMQKIAFLAPVLSRLPEEISREIYESIP